MLIRIMLTNTSLTSLHQELNWSWLRNLLRIVEDYDDIGEIIEKTSSSFITYLNFERANVALFDNVTSKDNDKNNYYLDFNKQDLIDRYILEDVFIKKQPYKKSGYEVIFPLETHGNTLGLMIVKDKVKFDNLRFNLLWSFADHLANKISDILLQKYFPHNSKKQLKTISSSISNDLKGFLEVSLEKLKTLEEQNQRLVELNKIRIELINNVSHELKTPLVSIMGFSNLLQRHELNEELVRESSQQILSAGNRLSRMIDDLIQLNRVETKGWDLQMELADIKQIAQYVIGEFAPINKTHNFVLNAPDEHPLIEADRKLLRQVIENLIINAIKYSPDGGTVTCTIKTFNNEISLSIQDEGIGMLPEDNQRVFERFYRVKNTQTQNISGLGLGLSICKDAITALNGNIWSESIFGEGSTFTISFPIVQK